MMNLLDNTPNQSTGAGTDDAAKRVNGREKVVVFKNYAPFTD